MSSNFVFEVKKRRYKDSRYPDKVFHCCICNKVLKEPFDYNSIIHEKITKIGWVCESEECVNMYIFRNL
jgi:hypothetical protein